MRRAPSRVQRAIWGLTIACAVALLCAVVWKIGGTVDLAQWWVSLAFVASVAVADFSSGLLHWAADTWGRVDLPVIGPRLLLPFRPHHANPDDFLTRGLTYVPIFVLGFSRPALLVYVFLVAAQAIYPRQRAVDVPSVAPP